jgi:hypothetical protein
MHRARACQQQKRRQADPISGFWQSKRIYLARETSQHVEPTQSTSVHSDSFADPRQKTVNTFLKQDG